MFPLAIEFEGRTLRGSLGVAYQPRAELTMTLDAALLGPAVREDLTLLGWCTDFFGATDLAYLAAGDVDANARLAHDLAQRYTGPVSGQALGSLFLVGLVTVGQGVPAQGSPIQASHLEGATWIEGDRKLCGMREGSSCLFVRPREAREWIGPLFASGAEAAGEARSLDADIAAALPQRSRPPGYSVGDGAHGQIAARLMLFETDPGLRRLRIDVRGVEHLDAVLLVAAESAAVVELSHPGARAVEAGHGRSVVVWSVPLVELAQGPLELSYRSTSLSGPMPP